MDEITVVDLPEQHTAVVRGRAAPDTISSFLGEAFDAVCSVVPAQGLRFTGPPFARYWSMDETGWDLEAGFPVDGEVVAERGVVPSSLPPGRAARLVHTGPYDTVGVAWRSLSDWIVDNGYAATEAAWECYLDEPGVEQPRTVIMMPCSEPVRR
jgi:effector-binding domain-containing protein